MVDQVILGRDRTNNVLMNWCKIRDNLSLLNSLCISRHVICENPTLIEMHGFCDASESVYEIDASFCTLIKIVQQRYYASELKALLSGDSINKSNILNLSPFVDTARILRVGGRLRNSPYVFDKKHPILLPPKCHLSLLIFRSKHVQLYHVGPSALLAAVRDKFWITSGRNLAKDVTKFKNINTNHGTATKIEICCEFPFNVTGTDYAGPFLTKDKRGRGAKFSKVYLCIFICFSVKAVHVQLVTSLSTYHT
nr:unnamed protein product [Callosobruchus analis]